MILYHGSNIAVREPRILAANRELDFGKGFYLTSDVEQAIRWAKLTAKRRKSGKSFVTVYEIEEAAFEACKIRKFEQATEEWLLFVAANRTNTIGMDDTDIIIGPVANDRTFPTISLFIEGFLDVEQAIKQLLPQRLKDQYVFKTEKALQLLKLKEVLHL